MATRKGKAKKVPTSGGSAIVTAAEAAGRTVGRAVGATMAAVEGVIGRAGQGRRAKTKARAKRTRRAKQDR